MDNTATRRPRFLIFARESNLARSLTLLFDQLGDITLCDSFSNVIDAQESEFTLVVGDFGGIAMQIELKKICTAWPEIPVIDIALGSSPKRASHKCKNFVHFEGGVRPEQLYRIVREIVSRWRHQG